MHIYCLTKLNEVSVAASSDRYQNYQDKLLYCNEMKENVRKKELENSQNYAYSEIRIGKVGEEFYFILFRNNIRVGVFPMEKGTLKIFPVKKEKDSKVIDIIIGNNIIPWNMNNGYNHIKEIRIRCVKVFTNRAKAVEIELQNKFKNYAAKINETAKNFGGELDLNDAHEKAFELMGPLKLQFQAVEKRVNQKITDLYDAITDLCDSENGDKANVSRDARYNNFIDDEIDFKFDDKKLYKERDEESKDFSTCSTLSYEGITPSKINLRWFNASALVSLTFRNSIIFQTDNAWKIFEENISKLTNLHILEISECELIEIPETLFSELPSKVDFLIFEGNNLTKIPNEITKVKNLRHLSLNDNPNITTDGIPWDFLPDGIKVFQFKNTNVDKIPLIAQRLKNLDSLDTNIQDFKEIEVEKLVEEFGEISIHNSTMKAPLNTKGYAGFRLNQQQNSNDLSNMEFSEDVIPPPPFELIYNEYVSLNMGAEKYTYLRELNLSGQKLTSIAWHELPAAITILNLSNNLLTNVGSIKHLKMLENFEFEHNHLTYVSNEINKLRNLRIINLSHNWITKIDKGFEVRNTIKRVLLDLSHNLFDFYTKTLKEDLWDRLPETSQLILNENTLVEIPCQMLNLFEDLHVVDCKLEYICPQIYTSKKIVFNINLANNPKLKLSFIPKQIFPPPFCKESQVWLWTCIEDENDTRDPGDYCVIVSEQAELRNTKRYTKADNEFSKSTIEDKFLCKCCAGCNYLSDENCNLVERTMVTDLRFCLLKKEDIKEDYEFIKFIFYDHLGWDPGKWKTSIRTRLCDNCQNELHESIVKVGEKCVATRNKKDKKIKKSKKSIQIGEKDMTISDIEDFEDNLLFPRKKPVKAKVNKNTNDHNLNDKNINQQSDDNNIQIKYAPKNPPTLPPPLPPIYSILHSSQSDHDQQHPTYNLPQQQQQPNNNWNQYFDDYREPQLPPNTAPTRLIASDGTIIKNIIIQDVDGNPIITASADDI